MNVCDRRTIVQAIDREQLAGEHARTDRKRLQRIGGRDALRHLLLLLDQMAADKHRPFDWPD